MIFNSDNWSGAHPRILQALCEAMAGAAPAYGNDPHTAALTERLKQVFETDSLCAFPVSTGTAANAMALASVVPPWGAVLCEAEAHINVDECGALEFHTGGAKPIPLVGKGGKLSAEQIRTTIAAMGGRGVHQMQPAAISLTQATEFGTVYRPGEVAALAEAAHALGCVVHMDGARLANALAFVGCAPAEVTWRAGVDVLCLGGTKNGCAAAEVVIFFDPSHAAQFERRRMRAGHLLSKMRMVSAQLQAYLDDGLWLQLAAQANAMAARLGAGLAALPGVSLAAPVEANEVFALLPEALIVQLQQAGFGFYRWQGTLCRLVCAYSTTPEEVDALLANARGAL
jgi:threonine aldolase